MGIFDRALNLFAPAKAASNELARVKASRLREVRNAYDAASVGRRTQHWRSGGMDFNADLSLSLAKLRNIARDMGQNNAYAVKAKMTVANNVVGAGIVPRIQARNKRTAEIVRQHFETTAIDAAGRRNLYGLQSLAMAMVVESGECLVRMRRRDVRLDKIGLPFQLQIMEPDYLDTGKNGVLPNGNSVILGVEYDSVQTSKRVAYWLFPQHPGALVSTGSMTAVSERVDAAFVAHIFRDEGRGDQTRGVTWFAPVILRMRDFADYTDAQLVRQKIAACFAAFIVSNEDAGVPLTTDENETYQVESFEPGMIERLRLGEDVKFADPPSAADFGPYASVTLREIASGLGIPYESLTGDYSQVNFSSGRMGWIEFQRNIDAWRWNMFIPQFLDVLVGWTNDALAAMNGAAMQPASAAPTVKISWTPPKREMINPKEETATARDMVRSGLSSLSDQIRQLGSDPMEVFDEMASDNAALDARNLIIDSDPRNRTAQGNPTDMGQAAAPAPPAA